MMRLAPRGHYLAHEVGWLAGVSGDRIGQWARRGYIRASQSDGRPHVYSYQDVAEAMVVHELLDHGADLRSIPWQQVVEPENLRKIAGQLERGGWAVRGLPELRHIEVNPDMLSGRPVIRGKRVPASMVAELADREDGLEILHEDYDLTDPEIRDAQRWWRLIIGFQDDWPVHVLSIVAMVADADSPLDPGIAPFVAALSDDGVETFESCDGGDGHAYAEPTVRFHGDRAEGFRALAVAQRKGLPVASLRRVWPILDNEPTGPWWEMTFSRLG